MADSSLGMVGRLVAASIGGTLGSDLVEIGGICRGYPPCRWGGARQGVWKAAPPPPLAGILKEHLAGLGLVVGARPSRCKKGQAKHTLSVYIGCA